ncbi:hypothetical protein CROQUDRAFT_69592 [Cronartium quercuum f. sp. fusiforme G11]|uniref:Uncharacterized protein n=1 Tax=Cronartium quercuum f. sp. fusiforme G11 TaxID=708437 RepID=A0A9P6NAB0_9BASI|nr:hypothetical protein CROQUDRAFT_69592 [Cronartium quercuum f. sp. fusiforme G11]
MDCRIKPNHHYVIHLPSQMDWWGPLLAISEFPGEQLCGFLQKINTNGKVEEMSQTIMQQFCHQQQLMCKSPPEEYIPTKTRQKNQGRLFEMDDETYEGLLAYHQDQDRSWTDYRKLPYPNSARVLSAYAHEIAGLRGQSGLQYSKKSSSNIVKVECSGKQSWAKVLHILELMDSKANIVMLRWLDRISDEALDPIFDHLDLVRVVQSSITGFVPASSIVSTLSHRQLPAWTLGLNFRSLLLINVNPGDHDISIIKVLDDVGDPMDMDNDLSMI